MSSKILGTEVAGREQASAATPVLWRMVSSVSDARRNSHTEAERESVRKLDQARREAYAEGLAAGRQQAEEQFRPAVEGLAETLVTLARLRDSIREETIQDLVHLATSIAARVIHREVAVDPDALAGLIQAAFSKLQSREINRVRMHPSLGAAGSQADGTSRSAEEPHAGRRPQPEARGDILRDLARHPGRVGGDAIARDRARVDRQIRTMTKLER